VLSTGETAVTTSPVCGAHLRHFATAGHSALEVKDLLEIAADALA
jgi:hypothetical protein